MVSQRLLQTAYALIVVGLLSWPIPHFVLTQTIQSDPWKNFGLAMYATYYEIGVRVEYRGAATGWQPLAQSREADTLIDEFTSKRRTRGLLAEPDGLASALQQLTNATEMKILVGSQILDGKKGHMGPPAWQLYSYQF